MKTPPLLSNVRHRSMITPESPLSTRLIHISPSCWTIFYSFEVILKMGKFIASKKIQSDMDYVSKNT